jgi:hypothetical protein
MSSPPVLAIILSNDQVQDVIVESWPPDTPVPRIAVARAASIQYHAVQDLFQIGAGDSVFEGTGYKVSPTLYPNSQCSIRPLDLIKTLEDQEVSEVVAHVRYASQKSGFALHEDNTPDAVRDSADRLGIDLSDQHLIQAVRQLLHAD